MTIAECQVLNAARYGLKSNILTTNGLNSLPKKTLCPTYSRHHIRNLNVTYWVKLTGMMPPEYCGHYECSRCNWRHKHTIENKFKYCPGCGAKMINAQEDS